MAGPHRRGGRLGACRNRRAGPRCRPPPHPRLRKHNDALFPPSGRGLRRALLTFGQGRNKGSLCILRRGHSAGGGALPRTHRAMPGCGGGIGRAAPARCLSPCIPSRRGGGGSHPTRAQWLGPPAAPACGLRYRLWAHPPRPRRAAQRDGCGRPRAGGRAFTVPKGLEGQGACRRWGQATASCPARAITGGPGTKKRPRRVPHAAFSLCYAGGSRQRRR